MEIDERRANPPIPTAQNPRSKNPNPEHPSTAYRLTFVCTGNICRSPMAEVVTRSLLEDAGLGDVVEVTSSGVDSWHVGEGADPRAVAALDRHGYDGTAHRARLFDGRGGPYDLIVALDSSHVRALRRLSTEAVVRLRDFDPDVTAGASGSARMLADRDVADPYFGVDQDFDDALVVIERSSRSLVRALAAAVAGAGETPLGKSVAADVDLDDARSTQ